nr:DMT family transporter [Candidatus Dependentiae bacterium]
MIEVFGAFGLLASAIITNKIILYALSPELLVAVRMLAASLLLTLYSFINAHHRVSGALLKRYLSLVVTIACFTTFFPSNLKAYALAHMPSSKMAFFGTLDPFVAALFSYMLYNERLSPQKWLGLLVGCAGMLVLIFTSSPVEEQLKVFSVVSYPELAALFAIVMSRFGWILAQGLLRTGALGSIQLNSITMAIGGLCSLGVALLRAKMTIIPLSEAPLALLKNGPLNLVSPSVQLSGFLLYTILIGNVFG